MGRDVYSRIIYGRASRSRRARRDRALGCALGVALGLVSGFLGGWVDLVVQRLVDVTQALPVLVLALVMAAALGPSLGNTIVAISIPLVPYSARVIRSTPWHCGRCLRRGRARVGMSEFRIAVRHVLPNTWRR